MNLPTSGSLQPVAVTSQAQLELLTAGAIATHGESFGHGYDWQILTPTAAGSVRHVNVGAGAAVSLVRITATEDLSFEMRTRNAPRQIKVAWVTEGRVDYAVAGARSPYDAFAGHCYVSAFDGDTTARVGLPAGTTFTGLSAVFSAPAFEAHLAASGVQVPQPLNALILGPSRSPTKFVTVMPEWLRSHASSFVELVDSDAADWQPQLQALVADSMALLAGAERWPSRIVSPVDLERVRRARKILHRSLASPPTLRDLAHRVGINEFKLKAGYRQAFGTSVGEDLHESRMWRARELLLRTERTIAESAADVGYYNAGDFSVRFRRRFGLTPSAFRDAGRRSAPDAATPALVWDNDGSFGPRP